ncbi:hypothetical protein CRUP_037919, partial [Coryphaenoides rupestris]
MIDRRFGQPVYPSTPSTNHVTLLPESFLVSRSLQPISRRDFLSVLADVTSVSDCSHRTAGPHCDACLPGYYGNATRGSTDDCQRCACPLSLPSNNFSPTCHLGDGGEMLCDRCQTGYTGPRCGRCANGYFGQPTLPGGSCQPCECHDNLDLALPRSCDPITGQCLRCRQGYGGVTCESCADGYYGDAVTAQNCQ